MIFITLRDILFTLICILLTDLFYSTANMELLLVCFITKAICPSIGSNVLEPHSMNLSKSLFLCLSYYIVHIFINVFENWSWSNSWCIYIKLWYFVTLPDTLKSKSWPAHLKLWVMITLWQCYNIFIWDDICTIIFLIKNKIDKFPINSTSYITWNRFKTKYPCYDF